MVALVEKSLDKINFKKRGELEENSLEGKGEIMLENEEEYKEFNVDGEEGSADKESTVSLFECQGPSICYRLVIEVVIGLVIEINLNQ